MADNKKRSNLEDEMNRYNFLINILLLYKHLLSNNHHSTCFWGNCKENNPYITMNLSFY